MKVIFQTHIAGIYDLELFLPEQYPMEPPKVRFNTMIYHPNIVRLPIDVG